MFDHQGFARRSLQLNTQPPLASSPPSNTLFSLAGSLTIHRRDSTFLCDSLRLLKSLSLSLSLPISLLLLLLYYLSLTSRELIIGSCAVLSLLHLRENHGKGTIAGA
uniref:Uncharacterized protein n=1 Tax=Salix viminalis TaxID=40686 RepID=A0A6N2N208_SALVM